MRCAFGAALSAVLLVAAGCNKAAPPDANGVAVVDLNEVARRVGRDKLIAQATQERQQSLAQQLAELQKSVNEQFAEAKARVGSEPTDQEQQELETLKRQLAAQLNQAALRAQNDIQTHRRELVQKFQEQIRPVAQAVAQSRNLRVVLTNDNTVLVFDAANDITEETSKRLLDQQASTDAPAQPVTQAAALSDTRVLQ